MKYCSLLCEILKTNCEDMRMKDSDAARSFAASAYLLRRKFHGTDAEN